jgi:putative ABC transport system permease protein
MRLDLDTYKEILDTLTRNKTRSLLTGFGVFWGIFMLVFLMGGGNGMKENLQKNFEGFATNSGFVFPSNTTKPYKGFRKGRTWQLEYNDVERLKSNVYELDVVTPVLLHFNGSIIHGDKKASCTINGVLSDYNSIEAPSIRYGRFLNEMDMRQRRKVCVIGKKVYNDLYPSGGNPCGDLVRVDSIYYKIVGVDFGTSNMSIGGRKDQKVIIPLTLMQQAYNEGNRIDLLCFTGKNGERMTKLAPRIRQIIGKAHNVDPTDEKAIMFINTEEMFGMVDSLFGGVNFLIWLVGIGTLLAGAIGVSNIMLVTVRERTTEIGIRRAIGATPKDILSQIMTESLLLTAVAGMSGILFAVMLLQMLQMGSMENGMVTVHYQIGFWTAIGATIMISILGMLAGLPPALRAMSVKPVDAMRDE